MENDPDKPSLETSNQLNPEATDGKKLASVQSIYFLKEELDFFIDDFKRKRDTSRFATNLIKANSIVIGAILTILVGTRSFLPEHNSAAIVVAVSILTLTLSAAMTALSSWEAFSAHRGKWIRYRTTLSVLYTIRHEFLYRECLGNILAEDVDKTFGELMLTVHETNQEWMNLRSPMISGIVQNTKTEGS